MTKPRGIYTDRWHCGDGSPAPLGAAYLAGLAVGFWRDRDDLARHWALSAEFRPAISADQRDSKRRWWQRAVQRSLGWEEAGP